MALRYGRIAAALAIVSAGVCCGRKPAEPAARPVRVEHVAGATPEPGLRYSATIQPYEQIPLAFKVGGYVHEIRQVPGIDRRRHSLQQGDPVSRGSVLARVNPSDYQERVNQSRAQLAEAEATMTRAAADGARAESLYAAKAMTRTDYDATMAGLAGAKARIDAAQAQLETAQISLRDASLLAPIDGVVLSRSVEVGTLAGVGTVAFTVADLTRVKAVFGVPDLIVQRVILGAPLLVTSDAFGAQEFPGQVTAISPSADAQSRVFNVEVTIPNPKRQLRAGMIATVEVAPHDVPQITSGTPTVSVSAVVKSSRPGAFAVFVADGTGETATARPRDVDLGPISGNRVAVTRGLKIGERVVVSGASLLTAGDKVRVIPGGEAQ